MIAGENHLLIKVITNSDAGFDFVPKNNIRPSVRDKSHKSDLPGFVLDILTTAADSRTDAQRQAVRDHYLMADAKYRAAHDQIQKLERRTDYATQRPVPETSPFLVAFGQPERQSACACDRSSAPTLLQSLELLNGNLVSGMIGASSGKYSQLDDDRLIDELYLAAFSRSPSEKDRENARQVSEKRAGSIEGRHRSGVGGREHAGVFVSTLKASCSKSALKMFGLVWIVGSASADASIVDLRTRLFSGPACGAFSFHNAHIFQSRTSPRKRGR